jgi:xanthine dehydrogenase accessory factor
MTSEAGTPPVSSSERRPLRAREAAHLLLTTSAEGGTAAVATVVGGPDGSAVGSRLARLRPHDPPGAERTLGHLGSDRLDVLAVQLLDEAMSDPRARDGIRTVDGAEPYELYVEIRRPLRELVVVGAGHVAQPMAHLGALLGYRVTVLDDRPDFATRERFPDADRLLRVDFSDPFAGVPLHERSHLLLVTRGHKYDYECLIRALRADPAPAYIGMIGSRRRVRATYVQLVDDGFTTDVLDRIHAPVGLDIGAETPEEIAVAVAAELVMLDRGGRGTPLREVERVAERFFGSGGADTPSTSEEKDT